MTSEVSGSTSVAVTPSVHTRWREAADARRRIRPAATAATAMITEILTANGPSFRDSGVHLGFSAQRDKLGCHLSTTMLFRNYPPLTHAQIANRMQEEGWFDETPWEIPGWFANSDE